MQTWIIKNNKNIKKGYQQLWLSLVQYENDRRQVILAGYSLDIELANSFNDFYSRFENYNNHFSKYILDIICKHVASEIN